jgi:serine/threonine-protein kinase
MIEVGQIVGNYKVLEKIAQGGMGDVYLAEHPVIGRKAALKVIHPQHARNVDVVARFVNEASALSRIGHDHIVGVMDFGRTPEGDFYFIMEYLDGRSLADVIVAEAPFAPARALELALQISDALTAAHAQGIIHRDLKPENVFLVARGKQSEFVKVLDFGLAKLLHDDGAATQKTRAGAVMGTSYYMSPEQCEGAKTIDGRTDIYALGVVLFEMLTGKLPFGGDNEQEVILKQMTLPAPPARSLVPDVPRALDAIVRRALAKAPAERFPNMMAFGEALLSPGTYVPTFAERTENDAQDVVRAARPMSRAEITRIRSSAPPASSSPPASTPPSSPPASKTPSPRLSSSPRLPSSPPAAAAPAPSAPALRKRRRADSFALLAALTSLTISAVGTIWLVRSRAPAPAVNPAPATVALSFSSSPDGATVLGPDGAVLGKTPLSIHVARVETPVAYVFQKPGFESKTMSLIPNVPSSLFASMQVERPHGRLKK